MGVAFSCIKQFASVCKIRNVYEFGYVGNSLFVFLVFLFMPMMEQKTWEMIQHVKKVCFSRYFCIPFAVFVMDWKLSKDPVKPALNQSEALYKDMRVRVAVRSNIVSVACA